MLTYLDHFDKAGKHRTRRECITRIMVCYDWLRGAMGGVGCVARTIDSRALLVYQQDQDKFKSSEEWSV